MNERAKRLRDALSSLVIQDAHGETCAAAMLAPDASEPLQKRSCTCGYIDRLGIARAALVADDDAEQTKDQPDLVAMEAAARTCALEARQWSTVARVAEDQKNDTAAVRARERAFGAEQCTTRIRKQLARFPVPANALGSEADIATRWRSVLYAESRLQAQRDEILDTIETAAAEGLRDGVPDGVAMPVPEAALKMHQAIHNAVKELLADQVGRPSPDFRALLLNTRAQLFEVRAALAANVEAVTPGSVLGPLKEALRLTDVERLDSWPPMTLAGIALRHVVDGLIEELSTGEPLYKIEPAHALDDLWIEVTLHDLRDARDKPDEYLARKRRGSSSVSVEAPPDLPMTDADRARLAEARKAISDAGLGDGVPPGGDS